MRIRQAPFALRVVRRRSGDAAILYRRSLDTKHQERLHRAAANLQHADGTEAAWWYGLMAARRTRNGKRAVRALRILVEAVK
jgi:hypothetical protein